MADVQSVLSNSFLRHRTDVLVAVGVIGLAAAYAPEGGSSTWAVINGLLFALLALAGVGLVGHRVLRWVRVGGTRTCSHIRRSRTTSK
jgi:hypothetical protein